MFEKEITETLISLIADKKFLEIKEFLKDFNEVDIAEMLSELKEEAFFFFLVLCYIWIFLKCLFHNSLKN